MNFGQLSRDWPEVELVNKSLIILSLYGPGVLILGTWRYVEENELSIRQGE